MWVFEYKNIKSASAASSAVTSGGLFSIVKLDIDRIGPEEMHSFESEKSRGHIWTYDNTLHVFVSSEYAYTREVAEMYVSNKPTNRNEPTGLATILIIIGALILFVIVVRWIFRKRNSFEKNGDYSEWENMIPSAKPSVKRKSMAVKENSQSKDIKKKTQENGENTIQEKKEEIHQKKKESERQETNHETTSDETSVSKNDEWKSDTKTKKEKSEDPTTENNKRDKSSRSDGHVRKISIREIPHEKLTAQDILDNLDEIPDYEDVFRHVNRDQEEIRQK